MKRAEKTLEINYRKDGVVNVVEPTSRKQMILYFENENIYKDNLSNGLIATEYNYN